MSIIIIIIIITIIIIIIIMHVFPYEFAASRKISFSLLHGLSDPG